MGTNIYRRALLVCAAIMITVVPTVADVTLNADQATRDGAWKKESRWADAWMIHQDYTLYKITSAKMYWTFPGQSGNYTLKVKVFAKSNGKAPIWVKVNGTKVWEGYTPYPWGRTSLYCCGSAISTKCPTTNYAGEPVWLDTKKTINIPNGARVEFGGTTVYPCLGSSWTDGVTKMGYGGGSYAGFFELLLGGGSTVPTPSIKLATQNLTFNAQEGGPNPSSANVSIINGGTGTLPALTASSSADWLTVKASGAAGNTQNITNTVDISGKAAGTYNATVTVSGSGVQSVTYTAALTIVTMPPVTVISPNGGEMIMVGDTIDIQWTANTSQVGSVDVMLYCGDGLTPYAIHGTGSISPTSPDWGSYKWVVPSEIDGESIVHNNCKVKIGDYPTHVPFDMSDSYFSIVDPSSLHLRFNLGGGSVDNWMSADNYVDGGEDYKFTGTVGVIDDTPPEVYLTLRHFEPSYAFDFIPDGKYLVRLHFADPYAVKDARQMTVTVNGTVALEKYCIVTEAGGGKMADVQDVEVSVTGGEGLSISVGKGTGSDAFINALEIIRLDKTQSIAGRGNRSLLSTKQATVRYDHKTARTLVWVNEPGRQQISLYAANGVRLSTQLVQGPGKYALDTRLAAGLAFIQVHGKTGKQTFKIVSSGGPVSY